MATTSAAAAAAAIAVLLSLLTTPTSAATFKCSGKNRSTCTSLLGFPVTNATTTNFTTIATLFNIPVSSLLSANGRSDPSRPVLNSTVRVPIPCTCSGGVGTSGNTTHYTVKKDDGLDHIARDIFGLLITFQEIAKANGIPNPDLIEVKQVLTIPLPCSCDQVVPGEFVVHYAYKVAQGDSIEGIASATGASGAVIQSLNGIAPPNELKEEQILDIPLKACGDSPSPLLASTNLTKSAPCPAVPPPASSPSALPGSKSPPTGSSAATALRGGGFGWTTMLVLICAGLIHLVH